MNIEEKVLKVIPNSQEYIAGFSDLTGLLDPKFQDYNHALVIGLKLDDKIVDAIKTGPTGEYFEHYQWVSRQLSKVIKEIAALFDTEKIKNIPMIPSETRTGSYYTPDYSKTMRMLFSHKMAATRAGLGWVGKTDLFISEKFGPRLRLATVLVDYPLKGKLAPVTESKCGDCLLCVKACPAGAANGKAWRAGVDRDEFYDASKCFQKTVEFGRKLLNKDEHVCGICMAVCPFGGNKEA
jgi:epoxyqueuosine reductase QueG